MLTNPSTSELKITEPFGVKLHFWTPVINNRISVVNPHSLTVKHGDGTGIVLCCFVHQPLVSSPSLNPKLILLEFF